MQTTTTTNGHDAIDGAIAGTDNDTPRTLDMELDPPIEDNGKTYTILHFEEPTGAQVQRAEQELAGVSNVPTMRAYQFALVSLCAQVPRSVILKMRISQIEEAARFLVSFNAAGRRTGET